MNRTMLVAAIVAVVCVRVWLSPAVAEPLTHVKIDQAAAETLAQQLADAGFDVLDVQTTDTSCELVVSSAELQILRDKGYRPEVVTVGQPLRDLQGRGISVRAVTSGYQDWTGIQAQMRTLQDEFPAICQVVDLTERYNVPPTFEGRHLVALKISDHVTEDEDEPACLLVGAHHAREIVTPVIALYAAEQLTGQYGSDPTLTVLVDEYEIWIAPVWNPDGYEHVFAYDHLWRKNRRVFSQGVGVDLNRNYPVGWDSACSGTTTVASQTYRGPQAGSESETQTMVAFGHDRHFAKVADLHSYGREVRYGYGCWYYPFDAFLVSEASDLAAAAGYWTRPSCCTGGDIHFHMATYGSYAFLWETHASFQPDFASAHAEATRVFPSLRALLQRPVPVAGHIFDATTGVAVAATITPIGPILENGETNSTEERWGRYHAFLPPGTHTLEFAAQGYYPQYGVVDVTSDGTQTMDIPMIAVAGDLNGDSCANMIDFAVWAACWQQSDNEACRGADLITDGAVDFHDFQALSAAWLRGPTSFTLTVLTGDGRGNVSPAGGLYQAETVMTLTATPRTGYRVKRWRGTDDDQSTACVNTVTMDSNKEVYVEFETVPENQ